MKSHNIRIQNVVLSSFILAGVAGVVHFFPEVSASSTSISVTSSSSVSNSVSASASSGGTSTSGSKGSSSASVSVKTIINGEVVEDHTETVTDTTGKGVTVSHESHHSTASTTSKQSSSASVRVSSDASVSSGKEEVHTEEKNTPVMNTERPNAVENTTSTSLDIDTKKNAAHSAQNITQEASNGSNVSAAHGASNSSHASLRADAFSTNNTEKKLSARQERPNEDRPLLLRIWHYVLSFFRT